QNHGEKPGKAPEVLPVPFGAKNRCKGHRSHQGFTRIYIATEYFSQSLNINKKRFKCTSRSHRNGFAKGIKLGFKAQLFCNRLETDNTVFIHLNIERHKL